MIPGLAEGRLVRYVLHESDVDPQYKHMVEEGRSIPALIVKVWREDTGYVNLTLFPDWSNDGFVLRSSANPQPIGIAWKTSVLYDAEKKPGTWHFPDRVSEKPATPPAEETAKEQ